MDITFLGVGEAFDERIPNTSILMQTRNEDGGVTLMLDCGYSVPPRFWQLELETNDLDGIWISHFHADHSFGLPAMLVRFMEEKRKKVLTLLGQKGIESFARKCLDIAYPNFYPKLCYPIRFTEVEPGEPITVLGLTLTTALNGHSQRDLALRLEDGGSALFYSGDGQPTSESRVLAHHADLIIHEAFEIKTNIHGHGTVADCLDMARTCKGEKLALVHINRQIRRERIQELRERAASVKNCRVLVPETGDRLTI